MICRYNSYCCNIYSLIFFIEIAGRCKIQGFGSVTLYQVDPDHWNTDPPENTRKLIY